MSRTEKVFQQAFRFTDHPCSSLAEACLNYPLLATTTSWIEGLVNWQKRPTSMPSYVLHYSTGGEIYALLNNECTKLSMQEYLRQLRISHKKPAAIAVALDQVADNGVFKTMVAALRPGGLLYCCTQSEIFMGIWDELVRATSELVTIENVVVNNKFLGAKTHKYGKLSPDFNPSNY